MLLEVLREQAAVEGESAATPAAYEEGGRAYISGELERRFGLRAVLCASAHRLEGEIMDDAHSSVEWDFRMPVTVSAAPTHPGKAADFLVFPDKDQYARPPQPAIGRHLTPSKLPGGAEPLPCDYAAIFEITTSGYWPKALLPRLEARLRVSLDRARALTAGIEGILDVCAVIGVVSPLTCQRGVAARITAGVFPLLSAMMHSAGLFSSSDTTRRDLLRQAHKNYLRECTPPFKRSNCSREVVHAVACSSCAAGYTGTLPRLLT